MALVQCHECKREVSSEAKSCPNCGAKVRPPTKKASRLLVLLLGGAVGVSVITAMMGGYQRAEEQRAEEARQAALTPEQRAAEQAGREKQAAKDAAEAQAKATEAARLRAVANDAAQAEAVCQLAAEKAANDPSSIEWLRQERQFGYTSPDKAKATSVQPMRAKNAMGAMVRTGVKCELVKSGGQWEVQRMREAR